MTIKVYTCPKCKKKSSYPKYNGYSETKFTFYQIGVECPYCGEDEYFAYFDPMTIFIEDDNASDKKEGK